MNTSFLSHSLLARREVHLDGILQLCSFDMVEYKPRVEFPQRLCALHNCGRETLSKRVTHFDNSLHFEHMPTMLPFQHEPYVQIPLSLVFGCFQALRG